MFLLMATAFQLLNSYKSWMMTKKYLIKDNYNKPHMVSVISNQGTEKKPFEMFVHISQDMYQTESKGLVT